jgi:DNA-nicking Smr family endonuclease
MPLDDESKKLFQDAMHDVTPLTGKKRIYPSQSSQYPVVPHPSYSHKPSTPPRLLDVTPLPADYILSANKVGLSKRQFSKLKQGRIEFNRRLDLHSLSKEQAYLALSRFIDENIANKQACCLIIHGKGQGLLKALVNDFLAHNSKIIAYHSANPSHGGTGAVYALLRF